MKSTDSTVTRKRPKKSAVTDAEVLYKALFERSPYGIVINDAQGKILDFNETAHTSLGYTREEFSNLSIQDIVSAGSEGEMQARIDLVSREGSAEFEAKHRTKSGAVRDVHVILRPLNLSGQPVLHSVWRDITESKRVEGTLRDANARLEALIHTIPDMVFLRDSEGRYVMVNKAMEEACGLPREEFVGRTNYDLVSRETAEMCSQSDEEAIRKGRPIHAEEQSIDKSGRTLFLDTIKAPLYDGEGNLSGLLCIARDITARKEIEEKLRRSEEFVRNILDNVDQGFLVIDRDFRIVAANKAYCVWCGADREGVVGRHCYEVSHRRERPCYEEGEECALIKVFETGEPHSAMHKHQDADGNTLYVETKAFPLKDRSGAVTSAIETIHDITERRLLEAEQLKSQKLEAIGTLAGGIAHDFNNLLQGVFGYMTMVKVSLDNKDVALTMLQQAEEALNMSISLTKQLLTFSKGGRPAKKSVSMRAVIENSVRFALSGSRCHCSIQVADDLWPVEADEGQVAQVIQNIVLNANEAMPDGGTVEVAAGNVELAKGGSSLLSKGGKFVRISIKDSGIGIPDAHIQRIFDPYFTTKQRGSGLGLATSYSIIKNHGGLIEVESELNYGSIFTIYLPASERRMEEGSLSASPAATRKGKILVMDDEDLIRFVVKEMVGSLGHVAETASDGEEAVEKVTGARDAGKPFDIVILDLTVRGGMGGEQAVRMLKEIDPTVKAVVSSGYADNPVVSDYRSHGFDAFLRKPYMLEALRETLNALLPAEQYS